MLLKNFMRGSFCFFLSAPLAYEVLCPLKGNEACALKGQVAPVSLYDVAILGGRNVQLHPVAGLHLEGDVVAGVVMMMLTGAAASVCPSAHYGDRNRQPGRVIVLVPLGKALDEDCNEHDKEKQEKEREYNIHNIKKNKVHIISLLFHNSTIFPSLFQQPARSEMILFLYAIS